MHADTANIQIIACFNGFIINIYTPYRVNQFEGLKEVMEDVMNKKDPFLRDLEKEAESTKHIPFSGMQTFVAKTWSEALAIIEINKPDDFKLFENANR